MNKIVCPQCGCELKESEQERKILMLEEDLEQTRVRLESREAEISRLREEKMRAVDSVGR